MKNHISIFVRTAGTLLLSGLLIFSPFGTASSEAKNYLSANEAAALTLGTGTLAAIGNIVKNTRTRDGKSGWTAPLPGEEKLLHYLGGKYYPGKTNFLDTRFGAFATPAVALPLLVGINMKWPRNEKGKDVSQDLFLLSTGLLATNGITELFKGIFRRQRPFVLLDSNITGDGERINPAFNNQSFFSGHTSIAFYTVTYLNLRLRTAMRQNLSAEEYKNWRWLSPTVLYGWATFVGWSRIHSYKHYPSDVLIGALVGSLLGELFYSLNDKLSSNDDIYVSKPVLIKINIKF